MILNNGLRFSNIAKLTETNFNITPSNVDIWRGDIPFNTGDIFPTNDIKERANTYLTNQELYKNNFDGILDSVFSWSDYLQDPITNMPNLAICADLPDWYNCTEAWVSVLASTPPSLETSIDVDDDGFSETTNKVRELSFILKNNNFAEVWQDIVRCGHCLYGNKIVKVSKNIDGICRIDNMPVKCWIPYIGKENLNSIESNVFFNIFDDVDGVKKCEFIAYVSDGSIIKKTFRYDGSKLCEQIGDTEFGEAFDGKVKRSPIIVFKGITTGGNIFGESQFKYWDASIASAVRNFEAIGVLVEQAKEIIRKIPSGATKTDEFTGITYQNRTGAIAYTDLEHIPNIEFVKVQIQLDQVISAYRESVNRVARDTGLPVSFFDTRDLHLTSSGVAVKQFMYRTEIMGNTISNNFRPTLKKLVSLIADASDLEIDDSMYDVKINNTAIMVDQETKNKTIMERVHNIPTMELYEAIKELDGVSIDMAVKKAAKLQGLAVDNIEPNDDIINDTSGENQTTDGIEFTASENKDGILEPMVEYPFGGDGAL